MTNARLWYIDSLRACLMVAGVFFHAALVYGAQTSFVVRDGSDLWLLDRLAKGLSSFRMPAFFVLAGMFWTLVLSRNALPQALRARTQIVLLPFVSLALTLQPLQHALLLWSQGRLSATTAGGFLATFLQPGELSANVLFGRPVVGHLWFLVTLLMFYWLAAGLDAVVRPRLPNWVGRATLPLLRHKVLWTVAVGGAIVGARALLVRGAGLDLDLVNVLLYLPYFAAGAVAFATPERFKAFLTVQPADLVAGAASAVAMFVPAVHRHVPGVVLVLAQLCFALVLTVLLLRLFRRFWNQPSEWQQRLVDASYSVYLFHYLIVVGLALALMPLHEVPALAKYVLVVITAIGVPLALHLGVIARVPTLRWLLNGRPPKRAKAVAAATAAAPAVGVETSAAGRA